MLEQGDLLTLNNKKEYIVMNQLVLKGKHYVYLISKDGISNIMICLFENDELKPITDESLLNELINKFVKNQGESL